MSEIEREVEDLWEEHARHTSEDWEFLKSKCSSCFDSFKRWNNVTPIVSTRESNENALGRLDFSFNNPLE